MTTEAVERPAAVSRIGLIDVARGVALLAMAVYHFTWDLEFFGYIEAGTTGAGGWKLFARSIAGSFLLLVGVSLVLAHGRGVRWGAWRIRLAMIVAAALVITVASYQTTPESFIFFGILHQIAFASVAGLLFLRLPWIAAAAAAIIVVAVPLAARSVLFDDPWWWWLGLSERGIRSNDYVPVFPWFGAVLAGMALAMLARDAGLLPRLAAIVPGAWSRPFTFIGRHSLAFYLIHQPVLIGLVWLAAQIVPAPPPAEDARFMRACQATCEATRDSGFCDRYCGCMLRTVEENGLLGMVFDGQADDRLQELAAQCTAVTEQDGAAGVSP